MAFLVIAVIVAAIFASILVRNHGTFVYTLDDPYIHLALSDQIRHGNYGLHEGTHAAPASSILYPFLLAIFSGTAVHPYVPLILNICALFFTVEIMRRFLLHLRLGDDTFARLAQAAALFLMALCFNLIGVVFTGLEHSLHIAMVAATVYGLALFLDPQSNDRTTMPRWLPTVIVLSPLLRYEGLALSIGALLVLALRGRVRTAISTFLVMAALVGGFSVFLVALGLPPLPSSVLAKSGVVTVGIAADHAGLLARLIRNFDAMTGHPIGLVLLLVGVFAAVRLSSDLLGRPASHIQGRWTPNGLMSLALFCLIAGQALAGRFGWLERYEVYAVLSTALIVIYIKRVSIRAVFAADFDHRLVLTVASTAAILIFGQRYISMTAQLPTAANNIYEQQLQMHRFVNEYWRQPVAVNDLGLVSYRNPNVVLDLGGLGSEKARLLMASHADADAYEAFVAENGIHFIMIYQEWFPGQIPDAWQHLATLSLSRPHISAAHNDVQFYATDAITAAVLRDELLRFEKTLPPRVKLVIY